MKSRRMACAENIARMGEIRNAYKILVRKPEGKRQLSSSRRRWKYNIKAYLEEIMCEGIG
jgi:hypothetical protein